MAYKNDMWGMLRKNGIKIVETGIRAYLRQNEWIDTGANIVAGGLRGGEIRGQECPEWVLAEYPTGDMELLGTRVYSKLGSEKELSDTSEIIFDDKGEIKGYKTGKAGNHPLRAYPDNDAEMLGLLHGITGGVLPGKRGFADKLHDRSELRYIAANIAFDYYMERGKNPTTRKSLGLDPFKRRIYTVQIPRTENDFTFIDPREYDIGLMKNYFKVGSWCAALEPFFEYPKKKLEDLNMKIDPAAEIQIAMADQMSKSAVGDLAFVAYPLLTSAIVGKKLLMDGWHFTGKNQTTH